MGRWSSGEYGDSIKERNVRHVPQLKVQLSNIISLFISMIAKEWGQEYYPNGTFGLSTPSGSPSSISIVMQNFIVALGVSGLFGIGAAALWCNYFGSKTPKNPKRVGWKREAIEIDPASVAEFHATWRSVR
jgi:hypothetical protein